MSLNWYNKYIKISARNILDADVIEICPKIFSDIQSYIFSGEPSLSWNIVEMLKEGGLKKYNNATVTISASFQKVSDQLMSYSKFNIGGLTINKGVDKQNIELDIRITDSFGKNSLNAFYMLLFNVLRHELQHVLDNINERYPPAPVSANYVNLVGKITNKSDEILSEKELESYIRGFMLKAKRERKSFVKIVEEYINIIFYAGNKNIMMRYPFYPELERIESETVARIISTAEEIYKRKMR